MLKRPLAFSLGDPAGVGAEVTFKAAKTFPRDLPMWFFGQWDYANATAAGEIGDVPRFDSAEEACSSGATRAFIEVAKRTETLEIGEVRAWHGAVSLASIECAAAATLAGLCSALVTAPIHKEAVRAAGAVHPGHTEFLAEMAGLREYGRDFLMMFDSPSFTVVLTSVHEPLTRAISLVTAERIRDALILSGRELTRIRGAAPRIGVAGLNPHAGEGGMFGSEENEIRRGIDLAVAKGVEAEGPFPSDTIFRDAATGRFDVVLAMYHDQGLIPVKTLHFDESVNVTLGLPYLRVSVDHGTAFDIAGKGVANAKPMRYAIEWANRHALKFEP